MKNNKTDKGRKAGGNSKNGKGRPEKHDATRHTRRPKKKGSVTKAMAAARVIPSVGRLFPPNARAAREELIELGILIPNGTFSVHR